MSIFNCDNILWQGGVTITYTLQDAAGNTCDGSVVLNPGNTAPSAGADTATVTAGETISIPVLANDTDPEGEALRVTEATATAGTVTVEADGTLSYAAPADFSGTVTVTYTAVDPGGNADQGTVVITVTPREDRAPEAGDDTATVMAGETISVPVLANDTDPEGRPLTVSGATASTGNVTIEPDGTLSYTAPADFRGLATVTYTIVDAAGNAAQGRVAVTVSLPDLPPVTGADVATVVAGGTVMIPVLANDADPEGGALTVTGATATTGTITVETDGTLRYVAPVGYTGTHTVGYTVEDAAGNRTEGTVAVTVIPSIALIGPNASGDITVDAASGDVTVIVYEPAEYAGEFLLHTSDLEAGPANLVPPQITGGTAIGDTLTAMAGIWAYDEAHGAIAFTQQWYRGDAPIEGATGTSYTVADGDAEAGLKFVRTATNAAGAQSIEVEAIGQVALPPAQVEAGVRFDGTTKLVRDADLGADSGAVFFFVDLIPNIVGRNGILRQTSTGNGVEFWNGQFRFYMGGISSSRALVAGQRARFVAAGWFDGTNTHRAVWSRLGDEPGWTLDQDSVAPGAVSFDLTFGGFTIGARHTGMTTDVAQGLDATVYRIALWSGSIPDPTEASTFDDFVAADGKLVDPAVAHDQYGTPLVDIFGKANDYMSGTNHGSAGNFDLVQGTLTDA